MRRGTAPVDVRAPVDSTSSFALSSRLSVSFHSALEGCLRLQSLRRQDKHYCVFPGGGCLCVCVYIYIYIHTYIHILLCIICPCVQAYVCRRHEGNMNRTLQLPPRWVSVVRLMIEILHYLKDPKLRELWYIPYYG